MAAFTGILELCTGNVLLMTVLTVALVWMLMSLISFYSEVFNPKLPPVPDTPLPVLGNALQMRKGPRETMARWRKSAGDVFRFYLGSYPVVVISGYDTLKEVFVKHADKFSDRPHNFNVAMKLLPDFDKGVANASGANWKEQRTVSLHILRNFGMGKNIMGEKIEEEVAVFLDKLGQLEGKARNVQNLTNVSVANVICALAVGKRFDHDDSYFLEFVNILDEQMRLVGKVNTSLLVSYPWLRFLPGDYFGAKKLRNNFVYVLTYFSQRYIDEQRPMINESDGSETFITEYLKEKEKKQRQNVSSSLDENNLQKIVTSLFNAGTETTSTTLLWYMLFMLNYPDIQKTVFAEIEEEVGTERAPTMQDKPKLRYLQAVLNETQRMGSIAPFSLHHACSETVEIQGYTIQNGSTVVPNLDSVMTDEKIWGDPENFRPERFLDSEGNLVHREELIPFSIGRRVCLGESLAKMELFLFASSLSQRFELLPEDENSPPPIQHIFGLSLSPKPFKVRFRERR